MKKPVTSIIAVLSVLLLGLVTALMWLYFRSSMDSIAESAGSMQTYDRHFLFVCDDDSEMWQSVYQYGQSYANANGAALEWAGEHAPVSYTLAESMEIGISSKVDGIILVPDGTEEIREAIDSAAENDIPVVNIMRDTSDSRRVSFVGASNYQMGELYGEQIAKLLKTGETRVCLLTDSANSPVASNLFSSQITSYLKNASGDGRTVTLYTQEVDSRSDFEAEEVIRGILMGGERPDILVCVNSVQTECAETALVDYNMVDDVRVIGYYASQSILSALRQDLLPAAITCDARQVGELSVEALTEYLSTGHVSDYFDITLEAVTNENVNRYVRSQHMAYSSREGS